jgi:MarR family transcriptional regulator, organic hydroperoxide resistance regulator
MNRRNNFRVKTAERPRPSEQAESAADGAAVSRRLPALLHRIVAVLVDATAPFYRKLGLSIPAVRVLITLLEGGGNMTVGGLSDTTSIDLSTTSHILRRLEAQAYLTRERQQDDNRVVRAILTTAGRRVAEKCRDASLRHEAALIGNMTMPQIALLKKLLETTYDNARNNLSP